MKKVFAIYLIAFIILFIGTALFKTPEIESSLKNYTQNEITRHHLDNIVYSEVNGYQVILKGLVSNLRYETHVQGLVNQLKKHINIKNEIRFKPLPSFTEIEKKDNHLIVRGKVSLLSEKNSILSIVQEIYKIPYDDKIQVDPNFSQVSFILIIPSILEKSAQFKSNHLILITNNEFLVETFVPTIIEKNQLDKDFKELSQDNLNYMSYITAPNSDNNLNTARDESSKNKINNSIQFPPLRLKPLQFFHNTTKLKPESESVLQTTIRMLLKTPELNLIISGYTDNTGDEIINKKVSLERAQWIQKILEKEGISSHRLKVLGQGSSDPIADNDQKEGRKKNRRVELIVFKE